MFSRSACYAHLCAVVIKNVIVINISSCRNRLVHKTLRNDVYNEIIKLATCAVHPVQRFANQISLFTYYYLLNKIDVVCHARLPDTPRCLGHNIYRTFRGGLKMYMCK